jgi:hypothetical protein
MTTPGPVDPLGSALQRVLASQHAAVYGYPVVGVHLSDQGQIGTARTLEASHRAARDQLMADLMTRSVTPDEPASNYQPPERVTDAVTAQRWALQLENDCAIAYRFLLASTATGAAQVTAARKQAIDGLRTAAQQATYWRRLLTPAAPTVAFPGS